MWVEGRFPNIITTCVCVLSGKFCVGRFFSTVAKKKLSDISRQEFFCFMIIILVGLPITVRWSCQCRLTGKGFLDSRSPTFSNNLFNYFLEVLSSLQMVYNTTPSTLTLVCFIIIHLNDRVYMLTHHFSFS